MERSCTSMKKERPSFDGKSSYAKWREWMSVDGERVCMSRERERLHFDGETATARQRRESGSCTSTGRAAKIFPWSSVDQAASRKTSM
ncbi:unnamed protein product [Lampetra planeri]